MIKYNCRHKGLPPQDHFHPENQPAAQQTPTPEYVLAALAKGYTVEDLIERGISEGSAAFIVRAVNAHEELLKACKEALAVWGKLPGSAQIGINPKVGDLLKQAIAKAEGK